jgi:hypothetical protein
VVNVVLGANGGPFPPGDSNQINPITQPVGSDARGPAVSLKTPGEAVAATPSACTLEKPQAGKGLVRIAPSGANPENTESLCCFDPVFVPHIAVA